MVVQPVWARSVPQFQVRCSAQVPLVQEWVLGSVPEHMEAAWVRVSALGQALAGSLHRVDTAQARCRHSPGNARSLSDPWPAHTLREPEGLLA